MTTTIHDDFLAMLASDGVCEQCGNMNVELVCDICGNRVSLRSAPGAQVETKGEIDCSVSQDYLEVEDGESLPSACDAPVPFLARPLREANVDTARPSIKPTKPTKQTKSVNKKEPLERAPLSQSVQDNKARVGAEFEKLLLKYTALSHGRPNSTVSNNVRYQGLLFEAGVVECRSDFFSEGAYDRAHAFYLQVTLSSARARTVASVEVLAWFAPQEATNAFNKSNSSKVSIRKYQTNMMHGFDKYVALIKQEEEENANNAAVGEAVASMLADDDNIDIEGLMDLLA